MTQNNGGLPSLRRTMAHWPACISQCSGCIRKTERDRRTEIAELLRPRLVEIGLLDRVECPEGSGPHLVVQLQVLVLLVEGLRVVAGGRLLVVFFRESGGKRRGRAGADRLGHSVLRHDQMSKLPGDVVGARHRTDQQVGILEVGQIAAADVVRRAVRQFDGLTRVHRFVPSGAGLCDGNLREPEFDRHLCDQSRRDVHEPVVARRSLERRRNCTRRRPSRHPAAASRRAAAERFAARFSFRGTASL